ncbi:hypothetical protein PLCT1_00768 [Planctomycetaceae bacterium]|nr:hypothetical protein PLCT1_00768 [Planctomycetaceae bacterium]
MTPSQGETASKALSFQAFGAVVDIVLGAEGASKGIVYNFTR